MDRAATLVIDALTISGDRPIISVRQRTADLIRDAADRWGNTRQVMSMREAAAASVNGDRS